MSDLSAIVSRLESVTSRLEGLARSGGTGGTGDSSAGGSGGKCTNPPFHNKPSLP